MTDYEVIVKLCDGEDYGEDEEWDFEAFKAKISNKFFTVSGVRQLLLAPNPPAEI